MSSPPPAKRAKLHSNAPKGRHHKKQKAAKPLPTSEEAIRYDIAEMLGQEKVDAIVAAKQERASKFERFAEVEVTILRLGSHGDGLGLVDDWVVAVPFCLPGERVLAKIYRSDWLHSYGDLVSVLEPAPSGSSYVRDDALVRCKYFGKCSGCQVSASTWLVSRSCPEIDSSIKCCRTKISLTTNRKLSNEHSRIFQVVLHRVARIVLAYHTAGLTAEQLKPVAPTLPSPLQYAYRTKLTPHFEAPPVKLPTEERLAMLAIGFETKGRRMVMDIEECPIATSTINTALPIERQKVKEYV